MTGTETLIWQWREEAERLRHRYGCESLACLCETHARELEAALRSSQDEHLTIAEAAEIGGYSRSHLRRLLDSGTIANVGGPGRPKVRVGDLPFKVRRRPAERPLQRPARQAPSSTGVRRISVV
jgi:hypothetical protein